MTATAAPKPPPAKPKVDRVHAKVKEQVIALLGKPKDLWRIDVHLYRAGTARVNIWRTVKVKPESIGGFLGALGQPDLIRRTYITDSFYLRLSKSAVIESANPAIERRY